MEANCLAYFSQLNDPRVDRTKRYPLIEIIFLIISATISGCDGWKSIRDFGVIKLDWLRKFLPYKEGIPVDDTIARVMRKLNTKQFEACFVNWMQSVATVTQGDVVAIDGKTLRRSHDDSSGKSAIHMVSAWSSANGVVLGQEKTSEKSNEITAIPELLNVLALKGCIVSIDAMGCQKEIAKKIIEKRADYVLALKGNQGHLREDVESFFVSAIENNFNGVAYDAHEEIDAGHGRIETRHCFVVDAKRYAKCFSNFHEWKNLKSIIMVQSVREGKKGQTRDTRFYISSCTTSAESFMNVIRKHWEVENSLHWTLDVTFREDESRIRKDAAPENFAIFRHIALNIIRRDKSVVSSVKSKRSMAALSDEFRTTLITQSL